MCVSGGGGELNPRSQSDRIGELWRLKMELFFLFIYLQLPHKDGRYDVLFESWC